MKCIAAKCRGKMQRSIFVANVDQDVERAAAYKKIALSIVHLYESTGE